MTALRGTPEDAIVADACPPSPCSTSARHAPGATLSAGEFTGLVNLHGRALHAFARALTHDHDLASDLAQETFCDAWRAVQQGTAPFAMEHADEERRRWLYRVAYRRAMDSLRRRRLIRWERLDGAEAAALTGVGDFTDAVAEAQVVRHALARLRPADAASLVLTLVTI